MGVHRNTIVVAMIVAILAISTFGIIASSENSNAADSVYLTSDSDGVFDTSNGSSTNPITDLSKSSIGGTVRNNLTASNFSASRNYFPDGIYVLVGAPVNISTTGTTGTMLVGIASVSSGFGVSISPQAVWNNFDDNDGYGNLTGTFSKAGKCTVTVVNGGQATAANLYYTDVVINVVEPSTPVTSISISGSSSGEVGDSITLTATASPSSADDRGVTFKITSGSSRATITSQSETSTGGRCTIELESAGSITVTATASDGSGVTKTKTITIYEPEILVTSVSISGSSSVDVGSTLTLTATTSPSNADDRTVNWSITSGSSHVTYTISDTSTGGKITLKGVSAGSVTVRATAADGSGEYATKTITVKAADVEITSSQSDTTISTGTAFSYTVGTNVSGCTISVSGADWLQVSGNTVYGTPTEAGEYDITITASKSGYSSDTQSFTIKVVSSLSFTSEPTTGLIIVEV